MMLPDVNLAYNFSNLNSKFKIFACLLNESPKLNKKSLFFFNFLTSKKLIIITDENHQIKQNNIHSQEKKYQQP